MDDQRCPAKDLQPQLPSRTHDLDSLLLEPFESKNGKIRFLSYAGGGGAGHVFKVGIDQKQYALKMFKFDHPELNASRLKGTTRKYFLDPFFIECRANGALIRDGLNGQITPTCYGWINIPTSVETYLARHFCIHPLAWDKPAWAPNLKIRGILFEWIDGHLLSQVQMSLNIADQARAKLKALHTTGIAHGDLRASNMIVQDQDPNPKVHLIDLSASITLPHIKFSLRDMEDIQRKEGQYLEVGFALLSQIPINRGLCFANLSSSGTASLDQIFAESQDIKHLWAPPRPTCWQPMALNPNFTA